MKTIQKTINRHALLALLILLLLALLILLITSTFNFVLSLLRQLTVFKYFPTWYQNLQLSLIPILET